MGEEQASPSPGNVSLRDAFWGGSGCFEGWGRGLRLVAIKRALLPLAAISPSQPGGSKDVFQRVDSHGAARDPASLKHEALARAPGMRFAQESHGRCPVLPIPPPSALPGSSQERDHGVERARGRD